MPDKTAVLPNYGLELDISCCEGSGVYSTYQDTTGHHHKVYSYKITGFTRFVFVTKSVFDLPKVLDVETSWLLLIEHRGSTEVWREERALEKLGETKCPEFRHSQQTHSRTLGLIGSSFEGVFSSHLPVPPANKSC